MADLSAALREAYARADTYTRHLVALELTNATFPGGAIRYVNFDRDLFIDNEIYTAMAMELREPEVGTDPANKVKVRIDAVAGEMQYYINAGVQSGTLIKATLRPFAFNMKTQSVIDIVGRFPYKVTQAQYDMKAAVLTLGHVSPTNQPFPNKRYTADKYPYLFR